MRFVLHTPALHAIGELLESLDSLLTRMAEDVHTVTFREADQVENSPWFMSLRPHRQELVRRAIEAAAWDGVARNRKEYRVDSPSDIPMAVRFANRPLMILVENQFSDGAFVELAVEAFADADTQRRWKAGKNSAPRGWDFLPAGGVGQMPDFIGAQKAQPPVRLLVLLDGDTLTPGHRPAGKQDELNTVIAAIGSDPIPLIVLQLREIENYIPDTFWDLWLSQTPHSSYRDVVDALKRLSRDQRDHFDMEKEERLTTCVVPGPLFDGSNPVNPMLATNDVLVLARKKNRNLKKIPISPGDAASLVQPGSPPPAKVHAVRLLLNYVRQGKIQSGDLSHRDHPGDLRRIADLIAEEL